jgi:N-acyl-D-aspartate/D-glutamate deacylase
MPFLSGPHLIIFFCFLFVGEHKAIAQDEVIHGDLLLRGGIVIDGTGAPSYNADILVWNGRIAFIGDASTQNIDAAEVVGIPGLVICPGFIDIHTHGDPLEDPGFRNFIAQGVTSIALGMDGSSVSVDRMDTWIQKVDSLGPGVNILPFVGHGTIRYGSGADHETELSEATLSRMKELLDSGLKLGCWGLSMGLEYFPGKYAGEGELEHLARIVGRYDGVITSHIRNEDDDQVEKSLMEMLHLLNHCRVNISHLKVVYGKGRTRALEILGLFYDARKEADNLLTADLYPYTASYTGIGLLFPDWARNKKDYSRIREERGDELATYLRNRVNARNGPSSTLIGSGPYKGKTLEQVAGEYDLPFEIVIRDIIGPSGVSAAYFVMDEDLQQTLAGDHFVMFASDGSPTMHHPRGHGTAARIIESWVVQDSILTLEEAVRKMTSLPAQVLGLPNRGMLRQGSIADLVVFNPAQIRERATFENPHQLATGIHRVYIGGNQIFRDGDFFSRSGRVILKRPE